VCSACPAHAGGSIVWTATLANPVPEGAAYLLGPATAAPAGDVYVSDADIFINQRSRIHQFSPAGAYVGVVGYEYADSGVFPPTFLGTDPLGDVLYSYRTDQTGGYIRSYARKRPPSGKGIQTSGSTWNNSQNFYNPFFGHEGGDSAGHWLVSVNMFYGSWCAPVCGWDFGNGYETGNLLLRYDAAGTYLGSIPNPGNWRLAPSGDLYVVKGFQGSIDVGCGPVTGGAGQSMVLSKLDLNGACIWSKAFSAPEPAAFTIGGDGRLVMGFLHTGTIDLGGGPVPSYGAQNLTIATLDLAGNVMMTRTVGGSGSSFTELQLDTAPSGIVVLASRFSGTVDLGAGPLGGTGDTLLAAFEPTGTLRWSKVVNVGTWFYIGYSIKVSLHMTRQPCNMVIATNSPTVDLGAGPIVPMPPSGGSPDIAVVALAL
jgi:hypothetical protein